MFSQSSRRCAVLLMPGGMAAIRETSLLHPADHASAERHTDDELACHAPAHQQHRHRRHRGRSHPLGLRHAFPFATPTSTCRSRFTICSAVCFFPRAIASSSCSSFVSSQLVQKWPGIPEISRSGFLYHLFMEVDKGAAHSRSLFEIPWDGR